MNNTRLSAYVQSAAVVLPAAVAASFAALFLTPKLQQIWRESGVKLPSETAWVVDASNLLVSHWFLMLGAIAAILFALEYFLPSWARYRRPAVLSAAVLFNTAVFAGLIAMVICLVLLAPALMSR
jgi:type II secretory pathway component PulF